MRNNLEDWQKARLEYTEDELYRLIVAHLLIDGIFADKREVDAWARGLGDIDQADAIIAFRIKRPGCIASDHSGKFECACGRSWSVDDHAPACNKKVIA